jgi:hypothetical protein
MTLTKDQLKNNLGDVIAVLQDVQKNYPNRFSQRVADWLMLLENDDLLLSVLVALMQRA